MTLALLEECRHRIANDDMALDREPSPVLAEIDAELEKAESGWEPVTNARECMLEMLAALAELLPEIYAEIEQRQHSGNDDWRDLDGKYKRAHRALIKAKGGRS